MEKPRTLSSPVEAENEDILTNVNGKIKSEDASNPFNGSGCYFTKSLQSDASFTENQTSKQCSLEELKAWVEISEIASDTESWMPNNHQINSAVEDKVNSCKEVDLLLDKFGINEATFPKCPQNDKQDDVKETENNGVHFQEDCFPRVHSVVETKHPVIIVKRLTCAVEGQEPELEDTEGKEKRKYSEYEEDASARLLSSPNDVPLHINKQTVNPPIGSTLTRATFSPGCPTDKKVALPALFSGLRVLRKGIGGAENGTSAQIKQSPPFAKSPVPTEKQSDTKTQIGFPDQITPQVEEDAKPVEPTRPLSSAEAAFDAFKAFFTPKPLKKDSTERIDSRRRPQQKKERKKLLVACKPCGHLKNIKTGFSNDGRSDAVSV